MKKHHLFIMVVVLSMVALFGVNAYAGDTFHQATLIWAGPSGNDVKIKLQDTDTSVVYAYVAVNKLKKELLAVALCAMINNMNVSACVWWLINSQNSRGNRRIITSPEEL
jgi:hypothetical protein